jgi:hypothetical protein
MESLPALGCATRSCQNSKSGHMYCHKLMPQPTSTGKVTVKIYPRYLAPDPPHHEATISGTCSPERGVAALRDLSPPPASLRCFPPERRRRRSGGKHRISARCQVALCNERMRGCWALDVRRTPLLSRDTAPAVSRVYRLSRAARFTEVWQQERQKMRYTAGANVTRGGGNGGVSPRSGRVSRPSQPPRPKVSSFPPSAALR